MEAQFQVQKHGKLTRMSLRGIDLLLAAFCAARGEAPIVSMRVFSSNQVSVTFADGASQLLPINEPVAPQCAAAVCSENQSQTTMLGNALE